MTRLQTLTPIKKGDQVSFQEDQQLRWAEKHDWYLGAARNIENQCVFIVEEFDGETNQFMGETKQFTNFNELYEWAGY